MLYLHIPYCHRKCSYCAFYSKTVKGSRDAYVKALCDEIEMRGTGQPLHTVYFGGGTPSLLPATSLKRIVDVIANCFDLSALEEVTLEANPEDLTPDYLGSLAELHFFNRISVGIQSFRDKDLKTINRVHSRIQAIEALRNVVDAGFRNISVDLMMGLPGQTITDWQANLDCLASLDFFDSIMHLSCYELSVEPDTILERQIHMGRVSLVDEEVVAAQYRMLQQWTQANGFEQYEISNYCRPGYHSRHNSRYWERIPYIGIGAAAHSFDGTRRRWNVADIETYIAGVTEGKIPYEEETLTERDAYNEYIMVSLRTVTGIDKSKVMPQFSECLAEKIVSYVRNGWVEETLTHYRPTPEGLLHADGIAASLFE